MDQSHPWGNLAMTNLRLLRRQPECRLRYPRGHSWLSFEATRAIALPSSVRRRQCFVKVLLRPPLPAGDRLGLGVARLMSQQLRHGCSPFSANPLAGVQGQVLESALCGRGYQFQPNLASLLDFEGQHRQIYSVDNLRR